MLGNIDWVDILGIVANTLGLIASAAIVVWIIVVTSRWRVGQIRWRFRAWRNRSRHPDLAAEYHETGSRTRRFMLAQQMMMRDRAHERMVHQGAPGPNYPIVWDYYFAPGKELYQRMRSVVARRATDEKRIQDELQRIKAQCP